MTDKLQTAITKGNKAKQFLEDETLKGAFEALEKRYIDAWRTTDPGDGDGREKLYLAVNILGKVKEHIAAVAANGRLAQAELDRMTSRDAA